VRAAASAAPEDVGARVSITLSQTVREPSSGKDVTMYIIEGGGVKVARRYSEFAELRKALEKASGSILKMCGEVLMVTNVPFPPKVGPNPDESSLIQSCCEHARAADPVIHCSCRPGCSAARPPRASWRLASRCGLLLPYICISFSLAMAQSSLTQAISHACVKVLDAWLRCILRDGTLALLLDTRHFLGDIAVQVTSTMLVLRLLLLLLLTLFLRKPFFSEFAIAREKHASAAAFNRASGANPHAVGSSGGGA